MSAKKTLTLAALALILGAGFALAQEQAKAAETNRIQAKTKAELKTRTMFMDQNGDGINDLYRDHDDDGIPNCQDPDWKRPKDGSGYKSRLGQAGSESRVGNRRDFQAGQGWSNASFRNSQKGLGGGICDGTGPKGKNKRGGRS
ncbi:MAG: hypothetical protein QHH14_09730 [Clostridiales bacterium]|jgi:hypothetical protein|nr:hypothetical protein [Clostridiales bacterium]